MKNIKKLEEAIAFYSLNLLTSAELVCIAQNLVTDFDCQDLNILAGESHPIMSEVKPLFESFLKNEKILLPPKLDAQLLVVKFYANLIIEGIISPYDGAKMIWGDIDIPIDMISDILLSFVSGTSQIEDLSCDERDSIVKKELENCIIEASKELLKINSPKLLVKK